MKIKINVNVKKSKLYLMLVLLLVDEVSVTFISIVNLVLNW